MAGYGRGVVNNNGHNIVKLSGTQNAENAVPKPQKCPQAFRDHTQPILGDEYFGAYTPLL